jgi:hypothetical protein
MKPPEGFNSFLEAFMLHPSEKINSESSEGGIGLFDSAGI